MREIISIHALREEGDRHRAPCSGILPISIHALREEGDLGAAEVSLIHDISIHALREEGDARPGCIWAARHCISIHALREEGDQPTTSTSKRSSYFYPRPPRGGRLLSLRQKKASGKFLSTPSARRATCCVGGSLYADVYFYPRPPRGGRRLLSWKSPWIR